MGTVPTWAQAPGQGDCPHLCEGTVPARTWSPRPDMVPVQTWGLSPLGHKRQDKGTVPTWARNPGDCPHPDIQGTVPIRTLLVRGDCPRPDTCAMTRGLSPPGHGDCPHPDIGARLWLSANLNCSQMSSLPQIQIVICHF